MQVRYLTADEIEDLHEQIILRYGGVGGVLSRDLLESASARPQTAILGQELYPTLEEKAAALMHSIIADHPFVDGNKRTAFLAAQEFLRLNGYERDPRSLGVHFSHCRREVRCLRNRRLVAPTHSSNSEGKGVNRKNVGRTHCFGA